MTTPTNLEWPDRMNASDALFWFLDTVPELRSTIGALLILERPVAHESVRAEFARLAESLPRFHQRVVEVPFGLAPPEWVADPLFDLDYHLRTIGVPAPGGFAELLEELGPVYATPLDRERPLWEAYVVEGLLDGRTAIFLKVHHCCMDGVGGSRILLTLLGSPDQPSPVPHRPPTLGSLTWSARVGRALRDTAVDAAGLAAAGACGLGEATLHPLAAGESLAGWLRGAGGFRRELTVQRAESPLHCERSLSRRLSTFDMSLAAIDAVRRPLGATNNDMVLTIVSGALHRWHTSRGADVKDLRAMVPVNLRGDGDDAGGNRVALLAIDLPIGEANPLRRLHLLQQRMGAVKRDHRANFYPLLARALVRLPLALTVEIGRQQTKRTNLVCTNVPGPRQTCYFAGAPIASIYAYGPLVGDHPVAIALYSYRDTIHVGLDVDPLAMPDLDHFRDALGEAYAEVLNIGGQEPAASGVSGAD